MGVCLFCQPLYTFGGANGGMASEVEKLPPTYWSLQFSRDMELLKHLNYGTGELHDRSGREYFENLEL